MTRTKLTASNLEFLKLLKKIMTAIGLTPTKIVISVNWELLKCFQNLS